MLYALCLLFAIGCDTQELPHDNSAPEIHRGQMRIGKMRVPSLTKPAFKTASFFDASCDIQPPDELKPMFYAAARRFPFGATDCELARQACAESGCCDESCDVDRLGEVESDAGAIGVSQFLPGTAAELGLDPTSPRQSIFGQAEYVKWCRAGWSIDIGGRTYADVKALGLCCYNWGRGNCYRSQEQHGWILYRDAKPHWPLETQRYVPKIMRDEEPL